MNRRLLKYIVFCVVTAFLGSCNDSEEDLLRTKVYFEKEEVKLEVEDLLTMEFDLQSRLSKVSNSPVQVSYEIADFSFVEKYNNRFGTNYESFDKADLVLGSESVTIPEEGIYSDKCILKLNNLDKVEEGKSYLIPIRIKSATISIMSGANVLYIIVSKPIRIMKVGSFNSNSIKVPLLPGKPLKSLTYETLIYINKFGSNNTVMGCEGVLILRIGDQALPGGANNMIQIAGSKQFHADHKFVAGKWYHVAFTYDQPSGKAVIYIDGEKAADSTWDTPSFDLTSDGGGFFIGKVAGFMWGERPLNGMLSEVRLWSVARTENQIKQNMLDVDPQSEGLVAYYKLNGTDQVQENDSWYVQDASNNKMNGIPNGGRSSIQTQELTIPIAIK